MIKVPIQIKNNSLKKLPNGHFRLFLHQHLACTLKMVVRKAIRTNKIPLNHLYYSNIIDYFYHFLFNIFKIRLNNLKCMKSKV